MPSAKDRFLETDHAKTFLNTASSAAFIAACDAATLQMNDHLGVTSEQVAAMANEYRRQGAHIFRMTLERIAVKELLPSVDARRNLKQDA